MKRILSTFFILILTLGSAHAETIYVNDNQNVTLKNAPTPNGKTLKVVPIGTPLKVIENKAKSDSIKVRLNDGTEGYIKARSTTTKTPFNEPKDSAGNSIAQLLSDNAALRAELYNLKESMAPGSSMEKSLSDERDQLARELSELKKTAASSIQLKSERDELQERVVSVERELQQFKLENQSLKNTDSQDWFLYGGLLSLAGVLLGTILPKLGGRRKSSWDSY